ncbi:MAG: FMN-binding negative transcriptional regulator [Pseudomonadales bacterium]|nr:FMN-binding negative transcriptional regulator [Pseudomonadales bacterium]
MYVPSHFLPRQEEHFSFIENFSFGELISIVDGKIFSTHLPFLIDESSNSLLCHVAKANPQWQQLDGQEVLAVFHGPHGYVSPSWYEKAGVPTWNYQAVHVNGQAKCFTEEAKLSQLVKALSDAQEAEFENPWKPDFDERMLGAIIGIEISISNVEAKHKLSQNRTGCEQKNIICQLRAQGNSILANVMDEVLKPTD